MLSVMCVDSYTNAMFGHPLQQHIPNAIREDEDRGDKVAPLYCVGRCTQITNLHHFFTGGLHTYN